MRFSQVFLKDKRLIERVIESLNVKEEDFFVEVGPGMGAITFPLLKKGVRILTIEIDNFLCAALRLKGVDAVCSDYLKTDVGSLLEDRGISSPVRFFSSVPYHITHNFLLKVFGERRLYSDVHLILQKEVADRLISPPRKKSYGPFSILAQTLFKVSVPLHIPRWAFSPIPKVSSSLVSLVPIEERSGIDVHSFLSFLKRPFGRRRKKIKNTSPHLPKEYWDFRPEELSPEVWLDLFSEFVSHQ
ncbi:MAG: ribosomal RNA small subunit methyltransferase A [Thermotogae bacterium]|nr:ribosomal RNA small subunit methyltransferase A [Thermotogota bacterium]